MQYNTTQRNTAQCITTHSNATSLKVQKENLLLGPRSEKMALTPSLKVKLMLTPRGGGGGGCGGREVRRGGG